MQRVGSKGANQLGRQIGVFGTSGIQLRQAGMAMIQGDVKPHSLTQALQKRRVGGLGACGGSARQQGDQDDEAGWDGARQGGV